MNILVVNPFGIGDVLFTTPVLAALAKQFPGSRIDYLCNSGSLAVLKHNPCISEFLCYSRGDLKRVRRESRMKYFRMLAEAWGRVRRGRYDLMLDLSLTDHYSLFALLAGVKKRYGFSCRGRGRFLTRKLELEWFSEKHVIDYYADLLCFLGIKGMERRLQLYVSKADQVWAERVVGEAGLKKRIAIAPFSGATWGANAKLKQWPRESYAKLIAALIGKGFKVYVLGSKSDKEKISEVLGDLRSPDLFDFSGKTDLGQLSALLSKMDLVVGNDGGPMHMAAALGLKCVGLYGPVDEKVYGPVSSDPDKIKVITADLKCRPCYRNFSMGECIQPECLEKITVNEVLTAVERIL